MLLVVGVEDMFDVVSTLELDFVVMGTCNMTSRSCYSLARKHVKQAKQVAQLEDDTQQVKASLCEDFNLHQSNERKIQFIKCELMKKVALKEIEELAKGNGEELAQHAKSPS